MKNCVRRNIKKHRDIKDDEKYITLEISLHFGSLDRMKIKSSEPKYYLRVSGNRFITSLGLKTIRRSNKKGKVCHYLCQSEGYF